MSRISSSATCWFPPTCRPPTRSSQRSSIGSPATPGDAVELFLESFHEQSRQNEIIEARRSVTDPDSRFLLALLLNVPSRRTVLELLAQRHPDRDPLDVFVDGIEELARIRELGSPAPNLLRVPDFGTTHRVVLRRLLMGGGLEEAVADLREVLSSEEPGRVRDAALEIVASLRGAGPLRAVLREE